MAKLNWNRPNGGYESEPWHKSWTETAKKSPKTKSKTVKPKDINLWGCETHPATVKLINYKRNKPSPVLWCLKCDKHLKSLSKEEYRIFKRL